MTDEFEDLVRSAGRSMGASGEIPTYHAAWRRGRRRRVAKRGALAAAGALALVVAFSADLGRLPGGNSVDVDDVASEAVGAPDPTAPVLEPTPTPPIPTPPIPTTAPLPAPDLDIDIDDGAPQVDEPADVDTPPTAATDDPAGTVALPPTPPTPAGSVSAAPQVTPAAAPTTPPEPTAPPTVAATPTPPRAAATAPSPTPVDDPLASVAPETTGEPVPVEVAPTAQPTEVGGDRQNPDEPPDPNDGTGATVVTPAQEPPVVAAIGQPADASVTFPGSTSGAARPCDTDGDGEPDARCQLLAEYECTSVDQLRDGYTVADLDGDGVPDWCVPDVATGCDLDGDGRSDLACVIRPHQENPVGVGP